MALATTGEAMLDAALLKEVLGSLLPFCQGSSHVTPKIRGTYRNTLGTWGCDKPQSGPRCHIPSTLRCDRLGDRRSRSPIQRSIASLGSNSNWPFHILRGCSRGFAAVDQELLFWRDAPALTLDVSLCCRLTRIFFFGRAGVGVWVAPLSTTTL